MTKQDKNRAYKYYLNRCEEIGMAEDLFDFEHEIGEDLSYSEIVSQLEDNLFSNLEKIEDLKLKAEAEELELRNKQYEKEIQDIKNQHQKNLLKLFDKPKIIGVCADVNQGKSMLLYHLLETIKLNNKFNLFTYGLRLAYSHAQEIYSVAEMEQVRDSLIIVDELSSLFDLDNRKIKRQIENSLRLINHNNNILILCGTPENFKKFVSAKLNMVFYKKTTFADCINGSRIKNILMSYNGSERGSEVLNLKIEEAILFDGVHYSKIKVPYYKKYDSKKDNVQIIVSKKVLKR